MQAYLESAETLLDAALAVARGPDETLAGALDALPAAIYVTDAAGCVTHANRACADLAGRAPEPGKDQWCVTWKLYSLEGSELPHEDCPMAVAIKERQPVRGVEAYAERPDGTRVRFLPFPTPLFDAEGNLAGAINLMIDVTDLRRAEDLRAQAARCRRLRDNIGDAQTIAALDAMAAEFEMEAGRLASLN